MIRLLVALTLLSLALAGSLSSLGEKIPQLKSTRLMVVTIIATWMFVVFALGTVIALVGVWLL